MSAAIMLRIRPTLAGAGSAKDPDVPAARVRDDVDVAVAVQFFAVADKHGME